MKPTLYTVLCAPALPFVFSCVKEVPEGGDTLEVPKGNLTIKVDMESSRSTLDGLSPEWAEGDVLSAVNATGNYRLWLGNASTGEFSGDVEGDYWPGVDFSGEMDGGGHAITNIQINADRKWVCFFSSVSGYVHDLTLGSPSDDSYFTSTATYGQVPAGGGTAITDAYVGPVGQVQSTGVSGTAQGTALTAGNWSNAGKFYGNKKDNVNLVLAGTNSCYFIP